LPQTSLHPREQPAGFDAASVAQHANAATNIPQDRNPALRGFHPREQPAGFDPGFQPGTEPGILFVGGAEEAPELGHEVVIGLVAFGA